MSGAVKESWLCSGSRLNRMFVAIDSDSKCGRRVYVHGLGEISGSILLNDIVFDC